MTADPPVEIERKFLVALLPDLRTLEAVQVRQGYLTRAEDSVEIRLRQMGDAHFMTLKSGAGLLRLEHEVPLDPSQFEALWPATEGRRIEKIRHLGQLEDQRVFELDVFSGQLAPLVLVEVEFDSVEAARRFAPPAWFGTDVTEDKTFKNKVLAMHGLPPGTVEPLSAG